MFLFFFSLVKLIIPNLIPLLVNTLVNAESVIFPIYVMVSSRLSPCNKLLFHIWQQYCTEQESLIRQ